jgi:hypothetical protein
MGNLADRIQTPISTITGGLVGDNLLCQLVEDMTAQPVFQAMFGANGERIFVTQRASQNETITPFLEMTFQTESVQSANTYLSGSIGGLLALPTKFNGDVNFQRSVAAAIVRFLNSDQHHLFQKVYGLIEFGVNATFSYDRMVDYGGTVLPSIEIKFPFKFDLYLLKQQRPSIDFTANLDAAIIGMLESVSVGVVDDNNNVLIATGVL